MSDKEKTKRNFKFADALEGCEDAINKYMVAADCVVYRLVHNPFNNIDELPNSVRKWENLTDDEIKLNIKLPNESSIEEQWEHVRNYSLSFNISLESLAQFMQGMYYKRKTDRQKDNFLKNMGDTIAPLHLSPKDGMIQKDPDEESNPGHVVMQPYEDFKLEDHIEWDKAKGLFDFKFEKDDKE